VAVGFEAVGAFVIAEHRAMTEAALRHLVLEQMVVERALGHRPVACLAGHAAELEVEPQPVGDGAALVAGEADPAFFQDPAGRVDVAAFDQGVPAVFDARQVGILTGDLMEHQQRDLVAQHAVGVIDRQFVEALIDCGDVHGGGEVARVMGQGMQLEQPLHRREPARHVTGGVGSRGAVFLDAVRVVEARQHRDVEVAEPGGGVADAGSFGEGGARLDQPAQQAGIAPQGRQHAAPALHAALGLVVDRLPPVDLARGAEVAAGALQFRNLGKQAGECGMHGGVAMRVHRHDLDEASGNVTRVVLERAVPHVTPLVVELRDLLAGEVGPQPRQRAEGGEAESRGAGRRRCANLATEHDARRTGCEAGQGQQPEDGGNDVPGHGRSPGAPASLNSVVALR
jgi:hypothetical protein